MNVRLVGEWFGGRGCGHGENEDCADILWLVVIVDGGCGCGGVHCGGYVLVMFSLWFALSAVNNKTSKD